MTHPATESHREWLRAPLLAEVGNERFEARRADRSELEPVFDLIDLAFGVKRSRAEYDWLYRRNPRGHARTWLFHDRASGRLVSAESSFPWPIFQGDRALRGEMVGDSVTDPEWRKAGLGGLRLAAREAHLWGPRTMVLGGVSAGSRALIHKLQRTESLMGPFPAGSIVVDPSRYLRGLGWPEWLAAAVGRPANATLGAWRAVVFRDRAKAKIEEVGRFDSDFDEVTDRCMSWPGFWCPHDSDFLNWRFLDHPGRSHVALAVVEGDRPIAYCVVRAAGEAATLVDFAAPRERAWIRNGLLGAAIEVARAAGCRHLSFSAPPSWRHWPLFRRAGFLPSRFGRWVIARGYGLSEASDQRNWQLLPGDDA